MDSQTDFTDKLRKFLLYGRSTPQIYPEQSSLADSIIILYRRFGPRTFFSTILDTRLLDQKSLNRGWADVKGLPMSVYYILYSRISFVLGHYCTVSSSDCCRQGSSSPTTSVTWTFLRKPKISSRSESYIAEFCVTAK